MTARRTQFIVWLAALGRKPRVKRTCYLRQNRWQHLLEGANSMDSFYWLGEITKASAVMVTECEIVSPVLGAEIAAAVAQVVDDGGRSGAIRSGDYLDFEAGLVAAGGPEVTRVHSGRSRQDIGATFSQLFLREGLLRVLESLHTVREGLLAFAGRHAHDIVPAYTWGVQAQPTTFGHWLGAYEAAFARTGTRGQAAYAHINRCPLGSAALGTSSFPVDRPRLAELLGFDAVAENSFDATQLAPADTRIEAAQIASAASLTVGMLIADLTQQYAQVRPWITLNQGARTGVSSIMPQKRNPTGVVRLRGLATEVHGRAAAVAISAHNVPSGMHDYKLDGEDPVLTGAAAMLSDLTGVLGDLRFDPARALEEVNAEYSTTTELADVLQREGDVPFRAGHHFASQLVTFGRANRLKPAEIQFADATRIYAGTAAEFHLPTAFPLGEERFRTALSAEGMVNASRGLGGPQPAEIERMLAAQREALVADQHWVTVARTRLSKAATNRESAFQALMQAQRPSQ